MHFRYFTDSPETVIARSLQDPGARLTEALHQLREHGQPKDGEWLMERLIEIAMADDVLPNLEISVIATIGQTLNVETETLARLMCEVAMARGQLLSHRPEGRSEKS